jgi:integrase
VAGRNANGEGTIYRRKDGRYEGAAYFLTTNGQRRRVRVYGKTRSDVHKKLIEAKLQAQRGIPLPERNWKLNDYLDYWQENTVRTKRRPATYHRTEAVIRIYLKPGLGNFTLANLSVQTVQQFIDRQLDEGRTIAVVHTIRKILSAALTQAMREELLFRNVARLVELPCYKPDEVHPWTVDETERFLEAARSDPLYPAFALVVQYGFRRGEILGLRWCDIDFEKRLLHVRQQLQRVGGELRLGDVKTNAGRRTEPLTDSAWNLLKNQHNKQQVARELAGDTWQQPDAPDAELVFTTRSGRPIEPRNFFRSFQRICEQHGIRRITVHHVRHTNATLQMNLGTHDRHIQAILGHADVSTTRSVYEHSDMNNRREALEKVERLFWRGSDSQRCRQLLPSSHQIVEQLTTFISGAVAGIRTRDPRLTMTPVATVLDRLTEVDRAMNNRRKQWLLGVVAVSVAVKDSHRGGDFTTHDSGNLAA